MTKKVEKEKYIYMYLYIHCVHVFAATPQKCFETVTMVFNNVASKTLICSIFFHLIFYIK